MRELLRRNDIRFVDWANDLSPADWAAPSLCTGWTNHTVLAHLVIGCGSAPSTIVAAMAHQRGSFDRANTELARRLAQRQSPTALLDAYTRLQRQPRGIGRAFPTRLLLGDHVIHELDICFAVGRGSTVRSAELTAVLNTEVRVPNPFVPTVARARNLALHATDLPWSHGTGPVVEGEAAHLASVLAGRTWALRHLYGDGVDELESRL